MMKKILYLAFAPILKGNGVAQKILAQRDAFIDLGNEVHFCYFKEDQGKTTAFIDNKVFFYLGGRVLYQFNIFRFFSKLANYVKDNSFDAVYIRYEKNANAGFVSFLKEVEGHCIRIMEIPTFPYDSEIHNASLYRKLRLWEERHYREKFSSCVDHIATFTDAAYIFGVRTLKISNAVDDKAIKLRNKVEDSDYDLSFIGVANLAFWHGYDRLLYGLREYYNNGGAKKIVFRIVGEGNQEERIRLKKIVEANRLENSVLFYGNKNGVELDELFNKSDFAIGCLGCHRKNIITVKSLKNVEYAMRGIPFIYSEVNEDFDNMPFVLKASADDTPIDINRIVEFLDHHRFSPSDIRREVSHLTWRNQMEIVCSYF